MSSSTTGDREQRIRETKAREQARNVEHYLGYWRSYPTADNWLRVIGAVEGYAPDEPTAGSYFWFTRPGGKPGTERRALGRYVRKGANGRWITQTFRKTTRTWTKA